MLRTPSLLAVLLSVLLLVACGDDGGGGDDGPDRATTPSAQACPPEAEQALRDAEAAVAEDDFDGALAAIRPYRDCPKVQEAEAGFRDVAAATTLRIARKHLQTYLKNPNPDNSPQAAVSLSRNSLRYKETPEARELYERAQRELEKFKERFGERPDEEPGGPPPGAGEGGPPEGRGGE